VGTKAVLIQAKVVGARVASMADWLSRVPKQSLAACRRRIERALLALTSMQPAHPLRDYIGQVAGVLCDATSTDAEVVSVMRLGEPRHGTGQVLLAKFGAAQGTCHYGFPLPNRSDKDRYEPKHVLVGYVYRVR
jgi:hypothetical protein